VGALVVVPLLHYLATGVSYKSDPRLQEMFASDAFYVPAAPDLLRLGAAPLFLCSAAWLSSRRRHEAAATARALLAFLALGSLLFAVQAFAPPSVRGLLPPRYAVFLVVFAAALGAGQGLDALREGALSRRALLGGGMAAALAWLGADLLAWGRLHRLPDVVLGELAALVALALVLWRRRFLALVPLATAVALAVSARRVVLAAGMAVPDTRAARVVRGLPRAPARVVGVGAWLDRAALTPNLATLSGHADVRAVAAIVPASYAAYLEGAPGGKRQPTSFLVERLDAARLDALGVTYAVARSDAAIPEGWKVVWRGDGVLVAENSRARRRAFVVGGGWADIVDYAPSRVVLEVSAPASSRAVLTDAFAPGWSATVDGREVSIEAFEGAFRAVEVPAGRHRVVMTYRPRPVLWGGAISAVTTVALVSVMVARRRAANRRGSVTP
jgi:hypothetical protein